MSDSITKQRRGNSGAANLKPCKPGETHNRLGINGATKRRQQLQEIGLRILGKRVDILQGGKPLKVSRVEAICIAMSNEAIKGDVGAATWCRDTAYGKPTQPISGPDGAPLAISYSGVVPPSKAAE